MAKVYIVTEEEFHSLIDQLKLESFNEHNIMRTNPDDIAGPQRVRDIHRAFHYVAVRWVQTMGCTAVRGS